MVLCRRSNAGFQKNLIVEEMLTTNYFQKISKRNEYLQKFKEYKTAYGIKWKKAKAHNNEQKYLNDIQKFIDDMKPFNRLLKDNKISKNEYLKILNKRKTKVIY